MITENLIDKCGRSITLEFDEDSLCCKAFHGGQVVGAFSFSECGDDDSAVLLMTHCHLEKMPGFTGVGIGTAILQLLTEYGYVVWARAHDGIPREDGSHLTGGGPGFVSSMVKKGLMNQFGSERFDNGDQEQEEDWQ